MRTRFRRRLLLKKILTALFLAVSIPAAAGFLLWTMPDISGYAVRAGLLSAGFALPEGGLAFLQSRGASEESAEPAVSAVPVRETEESEPVSEPEASAPEESSLPEEPAESLPAEDPEVPEEYQAALVHKTFTTAPSNIYIPLKNGYIKNCTSVSREEILRQVQELPGFTVEDTEEPQVLIMHTHATESYMPFSGDVYDSRTTFRTTDNSRNMAVVGDRIAEELEAAGIRTLHDVTQHDYPSYNGSYQRSRVTVESYLKKYPSIKVVLDIHRDAIASGDTVTAPVAEVEGKTAAQIMIISGCENESMDYPNYMQNLRFSAALQNQLEGDYPGLTRPVLFDYRLYNQDLTNGSILIEVGSHGNTLEQAAYSGELIGKALGELLNGLKK